jgi:hypothetical protein
VSRRTPFVARCTAVLLTLAIAAAPALTAVPSSAAVPRPPHRYTAKIEPLAAYKAQSRCSPWAKSGTTAFANLLLRTYPRSRSLGIVRACNVGAASEHKEGRAFDWGVSAASKRDRTSVKSLMTWLVKTDRFGHRYAMARRLGIQYMIWNRRIWGSYAASSGWRRYTGPNPHTDHVHFSLSWAGARKNSSFWRPRGFTSPPPSRPNPPTTPAPKPDPRPTPEPVSTAIAEPRPARSLEAGTALVDEQVELPAAKRAGVRTTGALQRGHRYLIEVSGAYRYSGAAGAQADAECSNAKGSYWRRDRSVRADQRDADHFDLYVDGHDLFADSDNGESCDTASHTYRWVYTPDRDGRVPLRIWDPTSHANNSGKLRIRIVELTARDRMTWKVPAGSRTGATSPGSLRAGVDYEVTLTGTWKDGATGMTADAECVGAGQSWRRDDFDTRVSQFRDDDLSAGLEDVSGEPVTDTGGRCDATGHAYRFVWRAGETQPLNVRVNDTGSYGDNAGSLRVAVAPYVDRGDPSTPPPTSVETVNLDAGNATSVQTRAVYPSGTRLRLTAKGMYLMREGSSSWIGADAECTITASDRTWRSTRFDGLFNGSRQPLGDVALNGRLDVWRPKDGSGSCDEVGHEYTYELTTDRKGPVSLVIADDNYVDNRGSVSVTVEVR